MTDRVLKFALIGCGRVSENHLAAITSGAIPAELAAIADIDGKKAEVKSAKYKVPFYSDYHKMMKEHPEIDVVNVATPTGYHAQHVIDISRYGKHIVVEKPMALRVQDCEAMIKSCSRKGCRLFVVKQNRFNPAVVAARAALEAGRFGKLVLGTVRVRWRRTQSYYEQDNWHGKWATDGGVMSQQASHHLDLLQWFMGQVESVQCQTATRLMNIEVEDTALATIRFRSGALGAFEATVAARPDDMEGSLSILGEGGSVVIGGHAVNRILHWRFVTPLPEDGEIQTKFSQDVPNVYGKGHAPYLNSVIEAITQNKPHMLEGEEGRKNIQILTALYESAARGGEVLKPNCRMRKCKLGKLPAAKS